MLGAIRDLILDNALTTVLVFVSLSGVTLLACHLWRSRERRRVYWERERQRREFWGWS